MAESQKDLTDVFLEAVASIKKKDSVDSIGEAIQKLNFVLDSFKDQYDKSLEVWCLFYLARAQQAAGNEIRAFGILEALLEKSLSISAEQLDTHDRENVAASLCMTRLDLAKFYQTQKRYDEAIECFSEAANYFLQKGDKRSAVNVYQDIAGIYQKQNDLWSAIEILQKALEIVGNEGTPSMLLALYLRIGHCYFSGGDLSNAILYESTALRYAEEMDDTEHEFILTNNLANFTFHAQRYRDAIPHLKKLLHFNEQQGDIGKSMRSLLWLGASYSEIGDYLKAATYYEKAEALFESQKRNTNIEYALNLLGKAYLFVDSKEFSKAKDHLSQAEMLLESLNEDLDLVARLHKRIREGENLLLIECSHRIINLALTSSTEELPQVEHTNPQPVVSPSKNPFITSMLSDEERTKFDTLTSEFQELFSEIYPIKWISKGTTSQPGSFIIPLRHEYVDDLEEFEIKWAAYKNENRKREMLRKLKQRWDKEVEKIPYKEGKYTGGPENLLSYTAEIVIQTQGYADIGDQETTREFALHAADFLEAYTDDKFLAVLLWQSRAELLLAIYSITQTPAKRLLETEILYSLRSADELVKILDEERQRIVISFLLKTWWNAGHMFMDKPAYVKIVEMAALSIAQLEVLNRLIYGISLYQLERYQDAVSILDKSFPINISSSDFSNSFDSRGYQIVLEAQIALANSRILMNCSEPAAWNDWLGPFAPYLYSEITRQPVETLAQLDQTGFSQDMPSASHLTLAFVDENLVVTEKSLEDDLEIVAQMHEMQHSLKRLGGQQLRTGAGQWFRVKRDVPVASAETYLFLLYDLPEEKTSNYPVLKKLLEVGRRCVVNKGEASHLFIQNMLQYFDDLSPQESRASYSCGAILVGMAFGFFGEESIEEVHSYIKHLSIYDHKEALAQGRVQAKLYW